MGSYLLIDEEMVLLLKHGLYHKFLLTCLLLGIDAFYPSGQDSMARSGWGERSSHNLLALESILTRGLVVLYDSLDAF